MYGRFVVTMIRRANGMGRMDVKMLNMLECIGQVDARQEMKEYDDLTVS
jgi:hypothetical protein